MEEYNFNVDEDLTKYKDDTEGLIHYEVMNSLELILEIHFEILVHSYDEFQFVKLNGLDQSSDIYKN